MVNVMKKCCLLSLFLLISCSSKYNDLDIKRVNEDFVLSNYNNDILIMSSYEEYTCYIVNHNQIKKITKEDFNSYYYICLLVTSNAEELRNGISFNEVKEVFGNYEFYFTTTIQDEATDLAYFITPFVFKVNETIKMENNIKINVERKILNK